MGKGQSFKQMVLKKLDIYMQKKFDPYLTQFTKINLKQIKDLNIRCKIIPLLEENI